MNSKSIVFASAIVLFLIITSQVIAQDNPRQKRLEKREVVNSKRSENIAERNPNGVGRVDNRVNRRGDRVQRKQHRTDKRVDRRRNN